MQKKLIKTIRKRRRKVRPMIHISTIILNYDVVYYHIVIIYLYHFAENRIKAVQKATKNAKKKKKKE